MNATNKKILISLLIIDLLLLLVSSLFGGKTTMLNAGIGFLSSTLVMFGSMASYRRMVDGRVEHEIITADIDKDVIEKIEDPYDLYCEDPKVETAEETQGVIKAERARLKQNRRSLFEVLRDTRAALSLYRIGAYALLVLGFLYLNRHGILHLPTYLLSLGLPIPVIVTILINEKESTDADISD